MKFQNATITADADKVTLHIDFEPKLFPEIHRTLTELQGAEEVEIKRKRRKRSNDQNAYMWELIGQVAERQNLSRTEVYRHIVKDYGIAEILPVKIENIDRWVQVWGAQGIGWICEDLGECRTLKGYHNIRTFYGTSTYNSKEMSRMIDGVVQEARALGIETLTPEQLERLKGDMNEHSSRNRQVG